MISAIVIVALFAVLCKFWYDAGKASKPSKNPPVFRHAVWPLPEDRPGAYVNDEPTGPSETEEATKWREEIKRDGKQ